MENTATSCREILLLDDEVDFSHTIQSACKDLFDIEVYTDPNHLLQKFSKDYQPEIIVADIHLPSDDGFSIASKLRQNGFTGELIFISGSTEKKHLLQAFEYKAFSVLEKPFTIQQFQNVLSEALISSALRKNEMSSQTHSSTERQNKFTPILGQRNLADREFLHDMAPLLMVLGHTLKTLHTEFLKSSSTQDQERLQKNWIRSLEALEKIKGLHAEHKERISQRELLDKIAEVE